MYMYVFVLDIKSKNICIEMREENCFFIKLALQSTHEQVLH